MRVAVVAAALCLSVIGFSAPYEANATIRKDAHIPAEALGPALQTLANEYNLQVLYRTEVVGELRTRGVSGSLTAPEALTQALSGTGLTFKYLDEKTVTIVPSALASPQDAPGSPASMQEKEGKKSSSGGFRVAQVDQGATSAPAAVEREPERTSQPYALQEVIVTAQRREERLQTVPISVTVFNQAALDIQGTHNIDDLARLTPAVTFIRSANNNNAESSEIAIRGIVSNAGAATTGVYIDDTPIQTRHLGFASFNTYPELFDIDRVEVLRGPQGTLFGSGSEGGTIRYLTPQPSLTNSSVYTRAEMAATDGGNPVYEGGVAAGVPLISDSLGMRASVSYRSEGGFVDRVNWHTGQTMDDSANGAHTITARLAFKWAPAENLAITPSVLYQKREVDDTAAWWWIQPQFAPGDPTNGQFNSPFRSGNEIASPDYDDFTLSSIHVDWTLGSVALVSNSSFFKRNQSAITDYSQFDRAIFLGDPYPPPGQVGSGSWGDDQENWTQEIRLQNLNTGRFVWTAGVFYQYAKETTRQLVYDPSVQADLGLPPDFNGGYIYVENPRTGLDRQIAVFGQADWKFTEALKLTVGARFARAQFNGSASYPTTLVVGPAFNTSGSETEHPFTPKAGLTYQLDPNKLLYLTISKGFRIGGTNPAVGQFCYGGPDSALGSIGLSEVPPTYGSDSVWSYEVGSKSALADNRFVLNASAYYIKWKNIQQNVPLTACGFQFTANLGEATSTGFDVQSVYSPNRVVSLGATLSYTDAKFTQTVQLSPTVYSIVQDGDHLPASPWTVSAFAQANVPLDRHTAYARVDYAYAAKQTDTVAASDPLNGGFPQGYFGIPGQSWTSLRAGMTWGGWDVSAFCQNLFNTDPKLNAQSVLVPYSLYTVVSWRPRTSGLTVTYRY